MRQIAQTFLSTQLRVVQVFMQMEHIGVNSLSIAVLTGLCSGAVLAVQSYTALKRIGGQDFIGPAVALTLARELGPVLTGLMVTARAGSSIAAELGTMHITEQIDALITLRINPYRYLIIPRIIAGCIVLPLVTIFTIAAGILGGYLTTTEVLHLNGETYLQGIQSFVHLHDVISGLLKAIVFGMILTVAGAYQGYHAGRGALGVGKAATTAVVVGSIGILIANYVLTMLLFE